MTWHTDLRELSDNALLARMRPLPPASSERAAICEVLVERYAHLVRACVRPYRFSPESAEDLMQVGYPGTRPRPGRRRAGRHPRGRRGRHPPGP